jgi:hypothetical protein
VSTNEQLWIAAWRRAGPALERVRRDELRRLDHRPMIAAFDDALEAVIRAFPPSATSGLVTQQQLFARLRSER